MKRFLKSFATAVYALSSVTVFAATPTDQGAQKVIWAPQTETKIDWEAGILPPPALTASDKKMIDWAKRFAPTAQNGMPTKHFSVDKNSKTVIGSTDYEIILSDTNYDDGMVVRFAKNGKPITHFPPADSLIVLNYATGQEVNFALMDGKGLLKISIILMVDSSGSMAPFKKDVENAVKTFSTALGGSTNCGLYLFDEKTNELANQKNTDCLRMSKLMISKYHTKGGGTHLGEALETGFKKASEVKSDFTAVVLISDGEDTASYDPKKLSTLKGNTPLYTYWLSHNSGGEPPAILKQNADVYLDSSRDVLIKTFMDAISKRYAGLRVIQLTKAKGK
ncbi:hypothetical protein GCM10011332_32330 [Terasakiella brassicae]|uniref:VWFA domain-containing protein n=1 Tax=Terasakiella brassicae TaxID=1634917 RepID=A0A917FH87_9PROT|nr:vWA domain-containing protein [Terasakiella brassicae]GGF75868.1 hypothetical protein GCM10011332_32330 [Terasakiella brassicae]